MATTPASLPDAAMNVAEAAAGADRGRGADQRRRLHGRPPTRIIMRRATRSARTATSSTAPEISQMFGELIGLWLADLWLRAGRPAGAHYVELGPGRGTLAADALRAMRGAGLEPPVELVETSPALRAAQRERLAAARWHDDVEGLPGARAAAGRRQRILRRAAGAAVRAARRRLARAGGRRRTAKRSAASRDRCGPPPGRLPRRADRDDRRGSAGGGGDRRATRTAAGASRAARP